jgi:hypothetical protein
VSGANDCELKWGHDAVRAKCGLMDQIFPN